MQRMYWNGRDPIGQRFRLSEMNAAAPWYTVIRVAGDVKQRGIQQALQPVIALRSE